LPALIESTGSDEVYGLHLDPAGPFHTKLILQKFLRGNANDVEKAKEYVAPGMDYESLTFSYHLAESCLKHIRDTTPAVPG